MKAYTELGLHFPETSRKGKLQITFTTGCYKSTERGL